MIFLMVLSLAVGLGSIAVSWHKSTQYKLPFINHLIAFLVALNAMAAIGIFYNYFGENLGGLFAVETGRLVDTTYRFFANFALLIIGGSLIFMLRALVDDAPSAVYLKVLTGIWVFIVLIFIVGIWITPAGSYLPLTLLANIALDQLVQYIVAFECARALFRTPRMADPKRRTWTQRLLITFGVVWLGLMSMSFLMLTDEVGNRLFSLLSSVFYVIFNALPLAFLGLFLQRAYGPPPMVPDNNEEALEVLCSQYGISRRERDVVRLICKGYPNKKIADELNISVSTVKDHNHHIFRKLAVTNRTELVAHLNRGV